MSELLHFGFVLAGLLATIVLIIAVVAVLLEEDEVPFSAVVFSVFLFVAIVYSISSVFLYGIERDGLNMKAIFFVSERKSECASGPGSPSK